MSASHSQKTETRWLEHNKGTWVAAGARLQILVPCTAGRFLSVQFSVDSGRSCDFDIMFEEAGGNEGAVRLYGPTRRATGVSTVLPLPQDGTAYVTWDNINSWWLAKCAATAPATRLASPLDPGPSPEPPPPTRLLSRYVTYTVCVSDKQPGDALPTRPLTRTLSLALALALALALTVPGDLVRLQPHDGAGRGGPDVLVGRRLQRADRRGAGRALFPAAPPLLGGRPAHAGG